MDGRQRTRQARAVSGFTLLELVVALLIAAIAVSAAAPSFGTLTRNASRTRQVNQFIQAVYLARSEAIKRNGVVSLCPSRDGASCSPGPVWQTGWIVFVNLDRDSPADRDANENLIQVYAAWDSGHITSNRSSLSFRPFGQSGVTATVTFCDDRGSPEARAVIISQTGRPRVSSRSASDKTLTCP
jgi:type IV fimbrial biogenesis protein FimT